MRSFVSPPQVRAAGLAAALACLLGVALFSVMDAAMKALALAIGTYSALLFRSLIGGVLSGGAMLATRNRWPPRDVLRLHVWRGAVVTAMAWLFFWALTQLPLAEAVALSFISPIIALHLSALLLKETIGRTAIVSALLGLAGVAIIISDRIGGHYDASAFWGALAVLLSAVLFAYSIVLQRLQAQRAGLIEISFFQNGTMFVLLLPLAPFLMIVPAGWHWGFAAISAILGVCSQMSLAWAYARAPASQLVPFEYSSFIWAALMGWIFFAEPLSVNVVAGVAVIVAACLIAARQRPEIAVRVEADTA